MHQRVDTSCMAHVGKMLAIDKATPGQFSNLGIAIQAPLLRVIAVSVRDDGLAEAVMADCFSSPPTAPFGGTRSLQSLAATGMKIEEIGLAVLDPRGYAPTVMIVHRDKTLRTALLDALHPVLLPIKGAIIFV